MKQYPTPYIYLDQNIREKMSKKIFESFQCNVNSLIGKNIQRFTTFGLLEFAGLGNLKKTELRNDDIQYKGQKLREYKFQSYQDVLKFQSVFKKQVYEKVPKDLLIKKLEEKKRYDVSEQGFKYIDRFIEAMKKSKKDKKDQSMYEGLIDNLYLDRLSQINISKLCPEDKKQVIWFFVDRVIGTVSQERNLGGLRLICKIFKERKNCIVEGEQSKSFEKQIIEICEKLKARGDLMDCELVHLAFFGSNKKCCHCYTTDDEETINERLILYCKSIDHFIDWYFNSSYIHSNNNGYKRPEWRCGKVFILDKNTGKKIKKISATKIYEKVLNRKIKS